MAIRQVVVSDIGGTELEAGQVAKLRVSGHPALGQRVIELDVGVDEAEKFADSAGDFVYLEVDAPGTGPKEVILDVGAFEQAFGAKADVQSILENARDVFAKAQPATRGRRRRSSSPASNGSAEKVNYASREHMGELHRGRITDEEKALVQADPAQASKNRERQTGKPIVWDDPKEKRRYTLDA